MPPRLHRAWVPPRCARPGRLQQGNHPGTLLPACRAHRPLAVSLSGAWWTPCLETGDPLWPERPVVRGDGSRGDVSLRTPALDRESVSSPRTHRGPAGGRRAPLRRAPGGEAWPDLGHRLRPGPGPGHGPRGVSGAAVWHGRVHTPGRALRPGLWARVDGGLPLCGQRVPAVPLPPGARAPVWARPGGWAPVLRRK